MLNEIQKKICEKYSKRDAEGKVHCYECPLVLPIDELSCEATYHYDVNLREWVSDEVIE